MGGQRAEGQISARYLHVASSSLLLNFIADGNFDFLSSQALSDGEIKLFVLVHTL